MGLANPLEEIAEAHRHVGQGYKRGGVAITLGHGAAA